MGSVADLESQLESLELELIEAESAKRYVEAQGIHDKTVALKKKIEVVREEEVANSNSLLQDELDQTYEREKESLTALWQEKLEEFERKAAENASELEEKQAAELEKLQDRIEKETSRRIKQRCVGGELLQLRKSEAVLVKKKQYLEADKVKKEADKLESREVEIFKGRLREEYGAKLLALETQHKGGRQVHITRTTNARSELIRAKENDFSCLQQRYQNICKRVEVESKKRMTAANSPHKQPSTSPSRLNTSHGKNRSPKAN